MKININNKILIGIILGIILVVFTGCSLVKNKIEPERFESIYLNDGSLYGGISYTITETSLTKTEYGNSFFDDSPAKTTTINIDSSKLKKIKNILKKYEKNIKKWKSRYYEEIDGGSNFNFSIKDKDNNEFNMECYYGTLPEDINKFKNEMFDILND